MATSGCKIKLKWIFRTLATLIAHLKLDGCTQHSPLKKNLELQVYSTIVEACIHNILELPPLKKNLEIEVYSTTVEPEACIVAL